MTDWVSDWVSDSPPLSHQAHSLHRGKNYNKATDLEWQSYPKSWPRQRSFQKVQSTFATRDGNDHPSGPWPKYQQYNIGVGATLLILLWSFISLYANFNFHNLFQHCFMKQCTTLENSHAEMWMNTFSFLELDKFSMCILFCLKCK